ncbi:hypothetical protein [Micromonospora tulbaghiae]|uniref:hypothetical protein n=1 Tax=Micromonospora tulbaghiae TaxID=479978 RepID=UPI0033BE3352
MDRLFRAPAVDHRVQTPRRDRAATRPSASGRATSTTMSSTGSRVDGSGAGSAGIGPVAVPGEEAGWG